MDGNDLWIETECWTISEASSFVQDLNNQPGSNFVKLYVEITSENSEKFQILSAFSFITPGIIIYELKEPQFYTKYHMIWCTSKSNKYHVQVSGNITKATVKYCGNFLAQEFKQGRDGILRNYSSFAPLKIHDIGNKQKQNLLIIAAKENNKEIVKDFVKDDFDVDYEDEYNLNAIDYAWKNYAKSVNDNKVMEQSNEIIMTLLKNDSKYPKKYHLVNFDYKKASESLQAFHEIGIEMRKHIENDDNNELMSKLENNSGPSHFYDTDNKSLMAFAMQFTDLELYKLLTKNGITTGSHEKPEETFAEFKEEVLKDIAETNLQSTVSLPEAHIYTILSKIKIVNNVKKYDYRCQDLERAFNIMNQNPFCNKVLKIAAACKNLKLVFDFRYEAINYMKPQPGSESTYGTCYAHGLIYIGANNLINGLGKFNVTGVIMHELCHLAILMTFMNNWNPYQKGPSKVKRAFKRAFKECKDKKSSEMIIQNVFDSYKKKDRHSELIVTVVQIIMQYCISDLDKPENEKVYPKIKQNFPKLWHFFEKFVYPALDNGLSSLEKLQDRNADISYEELTLPQKMKIYHMEINFQGAQTSFSKFIEYDSEIFKKLSSEQIRTLLLSYSFTLNENGSINPSVIERKLVDSSSESKKDSKTIKQVLKESQKDRLWVLGDHAGAGKTTALPHLVKKFKQIYKNHWISVVYLKNHESALRDFKNDEFTIDDVEKLLAKVLKIKNDFEKKVFKKLFQEGNVILLFDGIDLISSFLYDKFLKIVEYLKNETQIQQCITSRLHIAKQICTKFNVNSYKLVPLNWEEKMKMIKNMINSSDKENFVLINGLLNILDIIECRENNKEFCIENPLMLRAFAELFKNNSKELQIDFISNLFEFFEKLCEHIIDSNWKGYKNTFPCNSHIIYAFWSILNKICNNELDNMGMTKNWKNQRSSWKSEEIEGYRFMYVDLTKTECDQKKSAKFIHISYAEYFIAEYFTWHLFCGDNCMSKDERERIFSLIRIIAKSDLSLSFIQSLILSCRKQSKRSFIDPLKIIIEENFNNIRNDIINSEYFYKTFKFWIIFLSNDKNILKKLWNFDDDKEMLKNIIREKSPENSKELFKMINETFDTDWQKNHL